MISQRAKWRLILSVAFLIQVLLFNSSLVYGIRLDFFWIIFGAASFKFKSSELPLMAVIFGWLNGVFLIDSNISLAIFGFIFGLILSIFTKKVLWSLAWFRVIVIIASLSIFELIVSTGSIVTGAFWLKFCLFLIVHFVLALFATSLIIETVDE